ncbi:MAG: nucleotidyltransferase domain-containing protein [Chloroflexi bacterium]|nr:nucleotidyltransferase domain-containing protein [Chloroflexota bacterium]
MLGVVLTGSHAQGLATPWSDYDVRLILRDEADDGAPSRYQEDAFPNVDLRVMFLRDFTAYAGWDTPFAWDRYSFAHAQVLVDRTGIVSALVEEKGRIAVEHQSPYVRSELDAFINSVYRSLKCHRKGNALCTRLEASEAVQHGLAVIFALEGRIRPYPVALAHELSAYPPRNFPVTGDDLLELIAAIVERGDANALQRLFSAILDQTRLGGHGDVIDAWGNDIAWMQMASGRGGSAPRSGPNSGRC